MEKIVTTSFVSLFIVRRAGVWRLVFATATYDTYGDTHSLRYALEGKVYECKNCHCFRRIISNASAITKDQFELYIKYVIEQNYADITRSEWARKLEQKSLSNMLTNSELQALRDYRTREERFEDEMTQDITGTKGLTYFKCLIQ